MQIASGELFGEYVIDCLSRLSVHRTVGDHFKPRPTIVLDIYAILLLKYSYAHPSSWSI